MALLTSHLAGTMAEVQVGQALQRVLLTATAAGLATSFAEAGRRGAADPGGAAPAVRRGAAAAGRAAHRVARAVTPREAGDLMPETATAP